MEAPAENVEIINCETAVGILCTLVTCLLDREKALAYIVVIVAEHWRYTQVASKSVGPLGLVDIYQIWRKLKM